MIYRIHIYEEVQTADSFHVISATLKLNHWTLLSSQDRVLPLTYLLTHSMQQSPC